MLRQACLLQKSQKNQSGNGAETGDTGKRQIYHPAQPVLPVCRVRITGTSGGLEGNYLLFVVLSCRVFHDASSLFLSDGIMISNRKSNKADTMWLFAYFYSKFTFLHIAGICDMILAKTAGGGI